MRARADRGRAVHGRHDDVGDHQVDLALALEDLERRLAILGDQHGIAVAGQRALGDGADHHLVLDEQDGAGAPELAGLLLRLGLGRRLAGLGAVDRQIDGEAGALARPAIRRR